MKRKSKTVMFYVCRGVWVASWYLETGQRKTIRLPAAHSKEQAEDEYHKRQQANPVGILSPGVEHGLQTLINAFQRQVMPSYRPATKSIYRQMFGLLAKAGVRSATDIRPDKLRALTDVLLSEGSGVANQHKLLRAVRRFLHFTEEVGYLSEVPKMRMPKVRKRGKGRPLTDAEFELVLKATDLTYHLKPERAAACKRLLRGLWLSGLRIGEAANLSWDDKDGFHVDWTSYKRPVFVLPDTLDKTAQARVFPMTPDFWKMLAAVPEAERTGPVFTVLSTWRKETLTNPQLSKLLTRIGERSGVVVGKDDSGEVKYASAHDLRRSFGLRWAQKVNVVQLCALMRHQSVSTTQDYYLGLDASRLLDGLWG